MNKKVWKYIVVLCFVLLALPVGAQKFFNLTADEVKVDSLLPQFVYSQPLGENYQDSLYTVTLKYPEYVDMTAIDIANYNRLSGTLLPHEVPVNQTISLCRKKASLVVSFCPLVWRNNKYQMLVSFMLDIKAKPLKRSALKARMVSRAVANTSNYVAHSVFASGQWAKIRVKETGVHQLTEEVIRKAGFSNINKVKVYGYGGNLQCEALYADTLRKYDDLQQVSQCVVNGKHFFYAKGPVSWENKTASRRIRNPYSDYGYYFITESEEAPDVVDSTSFVSSFYPSADDYHSLYEKDGYSWMAGGRNLFEPTPIQQGEVQKVVLSNLSNSTRGVLAVAITAGNQSVAEVSCQGKILGTLTVNILNGKDGNSYNKAGEATGIYSLEGLTAHDTISIHTLSGGPVRLDYVSMAWEQPKPCPVFSSNLPQAEYVYNITNQDHHADEAVDMVIIIPTSQKLLKQAQRLQAFHESHDQLRVRIVPADELYNEFASGTPDANAYRRYLRMLQDRASTEADMPKCLLLFGDCVWDNRMLTSDCRHLNPDDYLLCYESENSFSKISCYVSDSWMGILSEGAGLDPTTELQDVAVGRFPVTTPAEAKIVVDKTINYMNNQNAGAWQNTIFFMGDDGNQNIHMADANEVADDISTLHPAYLVKKVMWDAYTRESSSTGNTYPEVTKRIQQQQTAGALIMDYAGHGSETQISHEGVLYLKDFAEFRHTNLPLWVTASCDIMPFDGTAATIGETALLNENGGAVAFYGTTRTVYAQQNKYINRAFLRRVLSEEGGKPITIGEAHRLAQNDVMLGAYPGEQDRSENHLQYALLGDPAMPLNLPTLRVVVDSINGIALEQTDSVALLKAGSVASIAGHIEGHVDFQGIVTATVRDSKEKITCKLNDTSDTGADQAFTYYDREKILYSGTDSVSNGKFAFSFAIPKDINYSDSTGLLNLYAVSADKTLRAHGYTERFKMGGSLDAPNDSIGPSIYCYLNSPSFTNGGKVNTTPYFVAKVSDKDGINTAGSGIGHDLQLVIDGDAAKTYVLNDNFTYDFGTYTSGSTFFSIPELEPGSHRLQFKAWDIQNNSSVATLDFTVVKGLQPSLLDVGVTENPAQTTTTFIVSHDRIESNMDVVIELYDTSGRQVWRHAETGVSTAGTYTKKWDLTSGSGRSLPTGIYLYRIKVSADGSNYSSKTKKLIIINNN